MAIIKLDPGESFEHYHKEISSSTLISGQLTITVEGNTLQMLQGEEIEVSEMTSHTVTNTGNADAVFKCQHTLDSPPPDNG